MVTTLVLEMCACVVDLPIIVLVEVLNDLQQVIGIFRSQARRGPTLSGFCALLEPWWCVEILRRLETGVVCVPLSKCRHCVDRQPAFFEPHEAVSTLHISRECQEVRA